MKFFLNLILFVSLITYNILPQGEAALPFLYLSPSPQSHGLGWTGVSNPTNDEFGHYYNPAMLGYFAQKNNLSMQIYPNSVDWLNYNQIDVTGFGFNAGYNFKKELNGLDLSVGIGYIRNRSSYGNFIGSSSLYESYDLLNSYALGASLNYYVTMALGITFKNVHSVLGNYNAKASAIDYGILLILPVSDLFKYSFKLPNHSEFIPELNYSLGYARLNIGDEIYYVDPAQKDPLPLTARLGHTISLGFDYKTENILINILGYDLILEADDILVSRSVDPVTSLNGEIKYDGLLGKINFFDNLILLKSNDNVIVHKGHAIKFAETVTILKGSFAGRGYDHLRDVKTSGLIISTSGFFKWLAEVSEDRTLKFVATHFEMKYVNSRIFDKTGWDTDISGLSVSLKNFSFN